MFKVVRIHYVSSISPAGEIFTFNEKEERKNATDVASFLTGKDVQNYAVIKDGFDIDLRGLDFNEMVNALTNFKGF